MVLAYPNLVLPDCPAATAFTPGPEARQVVAMQRGLVVVLPKDRAEATAPVFLDLREKLKEETAFEEGFHGLAFHPEFAKNRRFYLCYTQQEPRRTVLSEMCALPGAELKADPRSERVLLELPHPLGDHWGGVLAFGPDGFLYVSIGDGGLRDDPYRLAQNPWALQGKILRLDVNTRSGSLPYGIPPDNPFVAKQEIRSEIWALGFRNPWSLSFDPVTKTLWTTDVGQDIWEEINIVKKGGNYGWSEREGAAQFLSRQGQKETGGPFIDPVYAYSHVDGISITGGAVYRGKRVPKLTGKYIFGDWGHGKLWALTRKSTAEGSASAALLFARVGEEPRFNPTTIGTDAEGELLIFSHYPGVIYTLVPSAGEAPSPALDVVQDSYDDAADSLEMEEQETKS